MQEIKTDQLEQSEYLLYIYTPFCGTCSVAKGMLEKIETVHKENLFLTMNASLHPEFMLENEVKSVPCLLIKQKNEIKEKVYAFKSIGNLYTYLLEYKPELFLSS